jgi:hypothetical protein
MHGQETGTNKKDRYPLAGDAWEKIKHELALGHAEKERKLLESKGIRYE